MHTFQISLLYKLVLNLDGIQLQTLFTTYIAKWFREEMMAYLCKFSRECWCKTMNSSNYRQHVKLGSKCSRSMSDTTTNPEGWSERKRQVTDIETHLPRIWLMKCDETNWTWQYNIWISNSLDKPKSYLYLNNG